MIRIYFLRLSDEDKKYLNELCVDYNKAVRDGDINKADSISDIFFNYYLVNYFYAFIIMVVISLVFFLIYKDPGVFFIGTLAFLLYMTILPESFQLNLYSRKDEE